MEKVSRPRAHHRRHHSSATFSKKLSHSFGWKTSHDDLYSGTGKLGAPATRSSPVQDYAEIFNSSRASRGSSIPVLDLPEIEERGGSGRSRSCNVDYSKIFGGFSDENLGFTYEELFSGPKGGDTSSDGAWTPAETGSPSEDSDSFNSYEASHQPFDAKKKFNMSYHKINQRSRDGANGTTHIAQLHAVPGFTCVIDEELRPQKIKEHDPIPLKINDANRNINSSGGINNGKHLRAASDIPNDRVNRRTSNGDACFHGAPPFKETPHAGQVHVVPDTASFIDNPSRRTNENEPKPPKISDATLSMNRSGEVINGKHINRATSDNSNRKLRRRTSEGDLKFQGAPLSNMSLKLHNKRVGSIRSISMSSEGSKGARRSPAFSDEEVDVNSAAAASALALRKAIAEAQERIKIAKEIMERKNRSSDNSFMPTSKGRTKAKEKKDDIISAKSEVCTEKPQITAQPESHAEKPFEDCERLGHVVDGMVGPNDKDPASIAPEIRDESEILFANKGLEEKKEKDCHSNLADQKSAWGGEQETVKRFHALAMTGLQKVAAFVSKQADRILQPVDECEQEKKSSEKFSQQPVVNCHETISVAEANVLQGREQNLHAAKSITEWEEHGKNLKPGSSPNEQMECKKKLRVFPELEEAEENVLEVSDFEGHTNWLEKSGPGNLEEFHIHPKEDITHGNRPKEANDHVNNNKLSDSDEQEGAEKGFKEGFIMCEDRKENLHVHEDEEVEERLLTCCVSEEGSGEKVNEASGWEENGELYYPHQKEDNGRGLEEVHRQVLDVCSDEQEHNTIGLEEVNMCSYEEETNSRCLHEVESCSYEKEDNNIGLKEILRKDIHEKLVRDIFDAEPSDKRPDVDPKWEEIVKLRELQMHEQNEKMVEEGEALVEDAQEWEETCGMRMQTVTSRTEEDAVSLNASHEENGNIRQHEENDKMAKDGESSQKDAQDLEGTCGMQTGTSRIGDDVIDLNVSHEENRNMTNSDHDAVKDIKNILEAEDHTCDTDGNEVQRRTRRSWTKRRDAEELEAIRMTATRGMIERLVEETKASCELEHIEKFGMVDMARASDERVDYKRVDNGREDYKRGVNGSEDYEKEELEEEDLETAGLVHDEFNYNQVMGKGELHGPLNDEEDLDETSMEFGDHYNSAIDQKHHAETLAHDMEDDTKHGKEAEVSFDNKLDCNDFSAFNKKGDEKIIGSGDEHPCISANGKENMDKEEKKMRSQTSEQGEWNTAETGKEAKDANILHKVLKLDEGRKIDEGKMKERERENERIAVERAIREARERAFAEAREKAERASLEKAAVEAQQKVKVKTQERLEKKTLEVKPLAGRASEGGKLKAQRAAVERATAEARERALQKAVSEKAAFAGREDTNRFATEKFTGISRDNGVKQRSPYSDQQVQGSGPSSSSKYYSSANHGAPKAGERFDGVKGESAQRCQAKQERHQRTVERAAKALAEKNLRDDLAQKEQAERNRLAESLDAEVKRWSNGKKGNLRALLSTLQYILGSESGWQAIPLTDVVTTGAVKKAYRKAALCVHPDKLQQRGANIQQKYICEKVFDLLKDAWNKFNSEER